MKGQTASILKHAIGRTAVVEIFLEIIIILGQGVFFSYFSKQILESLLLEKPDGLLLPTLLLFLNLCLAITAQIISKRYRTKMACCSSVALENAILMKYTYAENRREYSPETVLGLLRNTSKTASEEAIEYIFNVARSVLTILASTLYVGVISPLLLGVILLITMLIIVLMRKDAYKLSGLYEVFFEHLRILDVKLWEQVKNHEIAGVLNLARVKRGYAHRNAAFLKDLVSIKKIDNKVFFARRYGPLFLVVLTVFCGGLLSRYGYIQISEIYAIVVLIPSLAGSLLALPAMLAEKKKYAAAHQVINDYFSCINEYPQASNVVTNINSVEIKHVSYRYPNSDKTAIKDITLSLTTGLNCLVGPSGGGKSTLILMILRILHPHSGCVMLNGEDIMTYDRESLYMHIGYVGQNPYVFKGTLRENILQNQPFDEQKYNQLLKIFHLDDKVSKSDGKTEPPIEPNKLSSGERQKIALARALYREPELLVLDEATSQMDPLSAQTVFSILKEHSQRRGCIVVYATHQEELIRKADRVYCIDSVQKQSEIKQ